MFQRLWALFDRSPRQERDACLEQTHRYRLRPAYGRSELLIELLPKRADAVFLEDLLTVLKQVNCRIENVHDLWMNDEELFACNCDYGPFLISRDVWDFVFVMAPKNQIAITKIENALSQSNRFWRETVDYKEYR